MCAHVCVGVRVGDRRYCQQRSPSAAVEAKSICWFLDVVKKPEVIMQTGQLKSRENQEGMKGEDLGLGSQGSGITLLESGLKQLGPPPGPFFPPFTTKERTFITLLWFFFFLFLLFCFSTSCFSCARFHVLAALVPGQ